MSTEAIAATEFLRDYTRELHNKNAAVFVGAGLSIPAGYVDWSRLLHDIARDLGLDVRRETDLVTLAQYHCNHAGGSKAKLTQAIFDNFSKTNTPTRNHEILASLPIQSYWTTNYDRLIEKALENAKKVVDVKYTVRQLATTKAARDVVLYKMHGDVEHAAEAVISKDDYEAYPSRMQPFVEALRGDLIEKTFLFLGFSFTDANIDYILSRVRVLYEGNRRTHYCIQRKVSKSPGERAADFKYRELKQRYFIRDLKRFGILTVLVDNYSDITGLLQKVEDSYKRTSVLISGAAHDFGPWAATAEKFLHDLGYQITSRQDRVVTGIGFGIGTHVLSGAISYLEDASKAVSEDYIVMRPFPRGGTTTLSQNARYTQYRKSLIAHAGIAIFVFGNRKSSTGTVEPSPGMREEFELCVSTGVCVLPIGATGFLAKELWDEVNSDFARFYPTASQSFKRNFRKLGSHSASSSAIIGTVSLLIADLQKF